MPLYENVFIARQDITSSQAEALAETFSEIVVKSGGTVSKKEAWGLRNLAYRVKKNRKGHYTLLNIDGPPAAISEMERNMRIHDDVLRFLTIRVDELEEGPSPILKGRDERPARGGRPPRHEESRPAAKPATPVKAEADPAEADPAEAAPAEAAPAEAATTEAADKGEES
ncbi:MAG: 30S ribosomal protein S6 [Rhodospirillales bacterium]|jgi:small subunit ribosomal protein S6|nr:30S ribosomal protein S6 [Rhodospirillales bacterium]MBT5077184.1 30S ribosomal protein S6 [Rhodospirillales bacterium]MBT5113241.1 30S ribosomal protein S6 [Rhodospirillales bacterium]MBT5671874.1 30S ribosomal protein S6 [Rhodospirillales bacterium]MBT6186731.1 30S ribosomal protein S6 [Rhodospirillales bacterium]